MIVKNEEKHLDKCLKSLETLRRRVSTEIIIVDTGSNDKTVEIAKRYTHKVYEHKWNNDFAEMRNTSIGYASGEWILVLDADEVLDDCTGLVNFLQSPKRKKYRTGYFTFKNFTDDTENQFSTTILPRLFLRTKRFRYTGKIHEQPQAEAPSIIINSQITHYGYLSTDKELMERKFKRNLELIKEAIEQEPNDVYLWYQLSATYGMHKDFQESLEANLKAYQIAKERSIDLSQRMYVYTHLAYSYYCLNNYRELEEICKESISVKDGYIDIYYYLGYASKRLGNNKEAYESYTTYLTMLKNDNYEGKKDPSVGHNTLAKYEFIYGEMTEIMLVENNFDKALQFLQKIKNKDVVFSILGSIISIYVNTGHYQSLKSYILPFLKNDHDTLLFLTKLEEAIIDKNYDEKAKIAEVFRGLNEKHAILADIRNMRTVKTEMFKLINYEQLPIVNSELIEHLIKNNIPIPPMKIDTLRFSLKNLLAKRRGIQEELYHYLINDHAENSTIIKKELAYVILTASDTNQHMEKKLITLYTKAGFSYIDDIYNIKNLTEDKIMMLESQDSFLTYVSAAIKHNDKLIAAKKLKRALNQCPELKKVVIYFLEQLNYDKDLTSILSKEKIEEVYSEKAIVPSCICQ